MNLKSNFSSRVFIFILLLSPFTIAGSLQNAFALTPVADLTGQWSGFAQLTDTDGYCSMTGKVNAVITQTENQLSGSLSLIQTSASSSIEGLDCTLDPITTSLSGTIDGSRITLYADEATLTGWYASSGIKLDVSADWFYGTAQLSPTGFTPPPFEPKDEPTPTPPEEEDTDGDEWLDSEDACPYDPEDYEGTEDGCPEEDTDGDEWFDFEDACPYDAEDYIGIEDGCPEEDADGDSFYDDEDVCPYDAEDYFEFGELDGCPETDADNDNIYDSIDQCIHEPEDTVGDIDGCPEEYGSDEQLKEWAEEQPEDWAGDVSIEGDTPELLRLQPADTETTIPEVTEPPSPSVLEIREESKPFFRALWDGKCDTLSHQWELATGISNRLPIVCTGGTIALPSGDIVEFSVADDIHLKLGKWAAEASAKVVYVSLAKDVRDFIRLSRDAAKMTEDVTGANAMLERIESMKALHLVVTKGEVELLGGAIKMNIKCYHAECGLMKMEEDGGGFKFSNMPAKYDSANKILEAVFNHHSVYILVEYGPAEIQETTSAGNEKEKSGCLIATATFGSEIAPQVQLLREIRDNTVLSTASGTSFMTAFNAFYYSFSPAVADLERQNPVFKEAVKFAITPMLSSLSLLQYVDINTESEILGYGIGVILLNIGMYFVAPALIVFKLKNGKKEKLR